MAAADNPPMPDPITTTSYSSRISSRGVVVPVVSRVIGAEVVEKRVVAARTFRKELSPKDKEGWRMAAKTSTCKARQSIFRVIVSKIESGPKRSNPVGKSEKR